MLKITIPSSELFNAKTNEFIYVKETTITLEHSLLSISKWESKWKKPFLGPYDKSDEEIIDYVRCMTITQNVDPDTYLNLSEENFSAINEYINDTMTATWFSNRENRSTSRQVITSELIYYWMISNGIPIEFQKWHLNRLLTLIRVCVAEKTSPKKRSKREVMVEYNKLNDERRKILNSKG